MLVPYKRYGFIIEIWDDYIEALDDMNYVYRSLASLHITP
jgi:hypothetical protein